MAASEPRPTCAHCGLPVTPAATGTPAPLYCCHACRMVALIIGKNQGSQRWDLLRLGLGTLLAMNIMMISLLLYADSVDPGSAPVFRLALLCLATPALVILLPPYLAGALREFFANRLSLDALIACGSLAAFSVSAVNVASGSGPVYFDTATMLPVLVTFGKIIESSAKSRAAELLHSLQALLPESALRVTAAGSAEVLVDELRPGDLIRVRPGERIAVDGLIREGTSAIEEASFTGEFLPRSCAPGDRVCAGTVNGGGSLVVEAEKTGAELLLYRIVVLIESAWSTPSQAERIAQRAAAVFVPLLLMIAVAVQVGWWLVGDPGQGLLSALSVLVVACPCTMGIATPLATSLAVARAARSGVVVRGGAIMELLARADVAYFDKTGTLTQGRPVLQETQVLDPELDEDELLGRLAVLESAGSHPLGRAVAAEAARRCLEGGSVSEVRHHPGAGISGLVTWRGVTAEVVAGSSTLAGAAGALQAEADASVPDWCSIVEVAWGGELRARLLFADPVRPEARACIEALAGCGVASVLLSGDRTSAAMAVASATGIPQVAAPRTPEQKLQTVQASVEAGETVVMVGDGVNDAPALAAAPVGIALGSGTDLARQAGNVVVLSGSLMQIPWLVALSRQTGSIIRGNFAWSFGYNSVALAAAAAGLLHPLLAALAMVASSLTVLGNSLRIWGFPEDAGVLEAGSLQQQGPGSARLRAQPPTGSLARVLTVSGHLMRRRREPKVRIADGSVR